MNRSPTDPHLIPRVKLYLEENVHQTYVDVGVMAKALQDRYREYQRRKTVPFRYAVEQAYKTVLHSYGLDSNPGSDIEEEGSDLEVMDEAQSSNNLSDAFTAMYKKKNSQPIEPTNDGELIDISSDDDESEDQQQKKPTEVPFGENVTITKINSTTGGSVNGKTGELDSNKQTSIIPCTTTQNNNSSSILNKLKSTSSVIVNKKRRIDNEENTTSGSTLSVQPPSTQYPKLKKFKKEVYAKKSNYTFADVGGMDKTLKELCELILHIKHPEIYRHIGLPSPRGFLLHGPPGSGKNLLAHAIAGQLDISLIEIPATELVAGVSGESEERIREVFEQAAALAPCVLFIDEIDAVSSNRMNAQKDMERRIVAQLLTSLDNLSKLNYGDQVLVVGATNRPDSLDPALRRVGRFDHEICLGIPDREARSEILQVICKNLKLENPFDFDEMATLTPGYVGADLLALATKAASTAIKRVLSKKENELLVADLKAEELTKMSAEPVVEILDESSNLMDVDMAEIATNKDVEVEKITTNVATVEEPTTSVETTTEIETKSQETEPVASVTEEIKIDEKPEEDLSKTAEAEPKEETVKQLEEPAVEVAMEQEETTENTENNLTETKPVKKPEEPLIDEIMKQPDVKLQMSLDNMVKWLRYDAIPLSHEELSQMCILREDFKDALKTVQPSAKREGFITVPDVTWDDIGSLQSIRDELKLAILAPVKFPERLQILGLQSPSGVLLCGPPGCGKTLLAKAVANEAGINFISVKGPELLNMYVGESERAVRQVFQRGRNSAPCVIFFDEFDSLCPKRSDSGDGSGASMRVVNQLLTEMDGMEERKGVFLMAATNRPDIVDPAVLRPGRLDKILYVGLPEESDRDEILNALTKKKTKPPLADDIDLSEIAKLTSGFTGADLAGLVRQASLQALKDSIITNGSNHTIVAGELVVQKNHFIDALKKIKPSVTEEDIKHYHKLKIKYGQKEEESF